MTGEETRVMGPTAATRRVWRAIERADGLTDETLTVEQWVARIRYRKHLSAAVEKRSPWRRRRRALLPAARNCLRKVV